MPAAASAPSALLFAAVLLASCGAQAQSLDEWIQRFGEAAAQQASAGRTGSGGSGAPAPSAAAAVAANTNGGAASRPCGAAIGAGELVLRSGSRDDCGIERLTQAVRTAAQAMNERRPSRDPGRDASRDPARDCDDEEACRRNVRTERLKEVASLKHEEDQMARAHNAPRNVSIPPARKGGGNWTWQTYQLGR